MYLGAGLPAAAVADVGGLRLRLADGREMAVKVRPNGDGRDCCVEAQGCLAFISGFPCASPLMTVAVAGGMAVHAEEWRLGDRLMRGDTPLPGPNPGTSSDGLSGP